MDCYGNTEAMRLADLGLEVPEYLRHDPSLSNNHGDTIALLYSNIGKEVPDWCQHDPKIQNAWGHTVYINMIARG